MSGKIILPVGRADFENMRTSGCYYVDKTHVISTLVRDGSQSLLFTRPRRFGKTTFLTMLKSFFDVRQDSRDLFHDLDVMSDVEVISNWMNKFPVIYVTFKDIDGLCFESALAVLRDKLSELFFSYRFVADEENNGLF